MKHGFLRHFVEMVIAMVAGMLFLRVPVPGQPYLDGLSMGVAMTLGMSIYMYYRGYGWRSMAEMGAAMLLPFLAALPTEAAHMVMMPLMGVAMWRHRAVELTPRRLPARWPSLLALVMTIDNWINPSVPAPWLMLLLPLGYVGFATVRKQSLGPQIAGLLGYLALTLAAVFAEPEVARYLVAAGWLAHAGWDLWHHRAKKVVPQAYAEWCGVVDAVIGLTIIFLM